MHHSRYTFSASANFEFVLPCTFIAYQNFDWAPGEVFSTQEEECSALVLEYIPLSVNIAPDQDGAKK